MDGKFSFRSAGLIGKSSRFLGGGGGRASDVSGKLTRWRASSPGVELKSIFELEEQKFKLIIDSSSASSSIISREG
jgi:hypothetical protein